MTDAPLVGTETVCASDDFPEAEHQGIASSITAGRRHPDDDPQSSLKGGGASGEASGGPQVFNRPAFIDRMMGDQEFAQRIAGAFVDRLPGMLAEVRESVTHGSTNALRSSVHKVKGSAANVGGEALSYVARQIEQNETSQELPELISELGIQADLLMKALKAWTIEPPAVPREQKQF